MKNTTSLILVVLLLFYMCMTGCEKTPSVTSTLTQDTMLPLEYSNPFSETPPEGDVIVTNLCFGQDLWPRYSCYPALSLRVLSKHPLDTSDCTVTMPIRTPYETRVVEFSVIPAPENENTQGDGYYPGAFPYYLYMIYQGTDWKKMAKLEKDAAAGSPGSATELQNCWDEHRESFLALTAKDLPQFYLYEVQIWFRYSHDMEIFDEECKHIELHLGDYNTVLEGGSFHIHAEDLPLEPHKESAQLGIKPGFLGNPLAFYSYPWNDGIEFLNLVMDFDVIDDITLTDFFLYHSRIELLQLNINITSNKGTAVDFCWDGKSPLKLKAGDAVSLSAVIRDPLASNRTIEKPNGSFITSCYDYAARFIAILRYDCGDEKGTNWIEYNLTRYPDPWETYAVWFDGLDISSYYMDYYQPIVNAWRTEFTEAQP